MANSATDFEKYPKYRLDQQGIDIQLILNNAAEYLGLDANTKTAGTSGSKPFIKQILGGAENLRSGENGEGSPVFFVDYINPDDPQQIINIKCGDGKTRPVAQGYYTNAEQIRLLFSNDIGFEGDAAFADLTPTKLPIIYYDQTTGNLYPYNGSNIESEIAADTESILKYTVETAFKQNLTPIKSTYHFYQNTLTAEQLDSLLQTQFVGQQCISIQTQGDYSATADSDPVTFYRITLGQPIVFEDSQQIINNEEFRVFKLAKPIENVNDSTNGIYAFGTDANAHTNFKTHEIRTKVFVYNYTTGETASYQEDDNYYIDNTTAEAFPNYFAIKEGTFVQAWIEGTADSEITTKITNIGTEDAPIKQVEITGNTVIEPSEPITIKHFRQMPTPAQPVFNPANGVLYCWHAGNPNGQDVYTNRRLAYTLKRPIYDEDGTIIDYKIYNGETAAEGTCIADDCYQTTISSEQSPIAFYLKLHDELTIKSRSDFYKDSEEIVVKFTGTEAMPESLSYLIDASASGFDSVTYYDLTNDKDFWAY
jgi:hypothetical protein